MADPTRLVVPMPDHSRSAIPRWRNFLETRPTMTIRCADQRLCEIAALEGSAVINSETPREPSRLEDAARTRPGSGRPQPAAERRAVSGTHAFMIRIEVGSDCSDPEIPGDFAGAAPRIVTS